MRLKGLDQWIANRVQRVQAGHRFLEDHAEIAAAPVSHLPIGQRHQVLASQQYLAGHDLAGRGYQTQINELLREYMQANLAHASPAR